MPLYQFPDGTKTYKSPLLTGDKLNQSLKSDWDAQQAAAKTVEETPTQDAPFVESAARGFMSGVGGAVKNVTDTVEVFTGEQPVLEGAQKWADKTLQENQPLEEVATPTSDIYSKDGVWGAFKHLTDPDVLVSGVANALPSYLGILGAALGGTAVAGPVGGTAALLGSAGLLTGRDTHDKVLAETGDSTKAMYAQVGEMTAQMFWNTLGLGPVLSKLPPSFKSKVQGLIGEGAVRLAAGGKLVPKDKLKQTMTAGLVESFTEFMEEPTSLGIQELAGVNVDWPTSLANAVDVILPSFLLGATASHVLNRAAADPQKVLEEPEKYDIPLLQFTPEETESLRSTFNLKDENEVGLQTAIWERYVSILSLFDGSNNPREWADEKGLPQMFKQFGDIQNAANAKAGVNQESVEETLMQREGEDGFKRVNRLNDSLQKMNFQLKSDKVLEQLVNRSKNPNAQVDSYELLSLLANAGISDEELQISGLETFISEDKKHKITDVVDSVLANSLWINEFEGVRGSSYTDYKQAVALLANSDVTAAERRKNAHDSLPNTDLFGPTYSVGDTETARTFAFYFPHHTEIESHGVLRSPLSEEDRDPELVEQNEIEYYDNVENELFWVRTSELDNGKTIVLDEVQSDVFQEQDVTKLPKPPETPVESEYTEYPKYDYTKALAHYNTLQLLNKRWEDIAIKSFINHAVESGYEKIVVPSGIYMAKTRFVPKLGSYNYESVVPNRIKTLTKLKPEKVVIYETLLNTDLFMSNSQDTARIVLKDLLSQAKQIPYNQALREDQINTFVPHEAATSFLNKNIDYNRLEVSDLATHNLLALPHEFRVLYDGVPTPFTISVFQDSVEKVYRFNLYLDVRNSYTGATLDYGKVSYKVQDMRELPGVRRVLASKHSEETDTVTRKTYSIPKEQEQEFVTRLFGSIEANVSSYNFNLFKTEFNSDRVDNIHKVMAHTYHQELEHGVSVFSQFAENPDTEVTLSISERGGTSYDADFSIEGLDVQKNLETRTITNKSTVFTLTPEFRQRWSKEPQNIFSKKDGKVKGQLVPLDKAGEAITDISKWRSASKYLVAGFTNADFSTGIHELAHFIALTSNPKVAKKIAKFMHKAGLSKSRKEGAKGAASIEQWDLQTHERFAELFEAWFMKGKAPKIDDAEEQKQWVNIFEESAALLKQIYTGHFAMFESVSTPEIQRMWEMMFYTRTTLEELPWIAQKANADVEPQEEDVTETAASSKSKPADVDTLTKGLSKKERAQLMRDRLAEFKARNASTNMGDLSGKGLPQTFEDDNADINPFEEIMQYKLKRFGGEANKIELDKRGIRLIRNDLVNLTRMPGDVDDYGEVEKTAKFVYDSVLTELTTGISHSGSGVILGQPISVTVRSGRPPVLITPSYYPNIEQTTKSAGVGEIGNTNLDDKTDYEKREDKNFAAYVQTPGSVTIILTYGNNDSFRTTFNLPMKYFEKQKVGGPRNELFQQDRDPFKEEVKYKLVHTVTDKKQTETLKTVINDLIVDHHDMAGEFLSRHATLAVVDYIHDSLIRQLRVGFTQRRSSFDEGIPIDLSKFYGDNYTMLRLLFSLDIEHNKLMVGFKFTYADSADLRIGTLSLDAFEKQIVGGPRNELFQRSSATFHPKPSLLAYFDSKYMHDLRLFAVNRLADAVENLFPDENRVLAPPERRKEFIAATSSITKTLLEAVKAPHSITARPQVRNGLVGKYNNKFIFYTVRTRIDDEATALEFSIDFRIGKRTSKLDEKDALYLEAGIGRLIPVNPATHKISLTYFDKEHTTIPGTNLFQRKKKQIAQTLTESIGQAYKDGKFPRRINSVSPYTFSSNLQEIGVLIHNLEANGALESISDEVTIQEALELLKNPETVEMLRNSQWAGEGVSDRELLATRIAALKHFQKNILAVTQSEDPKAAVRKVGEDWTRAIQNAANASGRALRANKLSGMYEDLIVALQTAITELPKGDPASNAISLEFMNLDLGDIEGLERLFQKTQNEKTFSKRVKENWRNVLMSLYYNTMLSSPMTAGTNTSGNVLYLAYMMGHNELAALVDSTLSRLTGKQRSVYRGGGWRLLKKVMTSSFSSSVRKDVGDVFFARFGEMSEKAKEDYKTTLTKYDLNAKGMMNAFSSIIPNEKIAKPLSFALEFPSRGMMAMDLWVKNIYEQAAMEQHTKIIDELGGQFDTRAIAYVQGLLQETANRPGRYGLTVPAGFQKAVSRIRGAATRKYAKIKDETVRKLQIDAEAQLKEQPLIEKYWPELVQAVVDNRARYVAEDAVFQATVGKNVEHFTKWRNTLPLGLGRVLFPFIGTITNLMKKGLELTPGIGIPAHIYFDHGMFRPLKGKALRQFYRDPAKRTIWEQVRWSELVAKQIEGAVMLMLLWAYMDDNNDEKTGLPMVTGALPRDPAKRLAYQSRQITPYSILVDGKYYDFRRFEPFGTVMAMAADYWQEMKEFDEAKLEPKNADKALADLGMNLVFGVGKTFLESTYFMTPIKAFATESGFQRQLVNSATTLLPYSPLWRWMYKQQEMAQTGGLGQPEPKQYAEMFGASIPLRGLAGFDPPIVQRDRLGKLIVRDTGLFEGWLPPSTSKPKNDIVEQSLMELELYPGLPKETVPIKWRGKTFEIPFDEKTYQDYVIQSGTATKERLKKIMEGRNWKTLSLERRATIVKKILESETTRVRTKLTNINRRQMLQTAKEYYARKDSQ